MKFDIGKKVAEAGVILGGLGVIGFLGIVWLMIYGNLSGNLGFEAGSTGFNNTENVINNISGGFNTFFTFSNTFFTIGAIILLIFMLLGLLAVVMFIQDVNKGGRGGFSGA